MNEFETMPDIVGPMPSTQPPPSQPDWRKFSRFIVDHNPFFLLSGVSMLLGCYLINAAAHEQKDRVDLIVGLLGVFNVYELLVIGLGLFLARGRGLVRDGAYLLLLEVLLLSDLTFLYTEVFTASEVIGIVVASTGFVLAIGKLMVIFHVMNIRLRLREWSVLVGTFLMLFAMPGVLRHFGEMDRVTPLLLHAGWWIAGGLMAALALPRGHAASSDQPGMQRLAMAIRIAVSIVPWMSIIAHMASAHYVYEVKFVPANLAPIMLGAAALLVRYANLFNNRTVLRVCTAGFCFIGIVVTVPAVSQLYIDMTWPIDWTLSPFRGATAISCFIALVGAMRAGGWLLPCFSVLSAGGFVLGHDGPSLWRTQEYYALLLRMWTKDLTPSSTFEWGVLGVIGAFIFLGVGTVLSLRKPPTNHGTGATM